MGINTKLMNRDAINYPLSVIRVLGIDPGTATVGWAILEKNKGEIRSIEYGHISTSKKRSDSERLLEISQDIEEIIKKYQPHAASVEDLFFFKNLKTAIQVAQARGAILLTLEKYGLTIAEYTPLQIKQALTGYGRAEKQQVQEMVKNILTLSEIPKPDDTADAIAAALCYLHSYKAQQ